MHKNHTARSELCDVIKNDARLCTNGMVKLILVFSDTPTAKPRYAYETAC